MVNFLHILFFLLLNPYEKSIYIFAKTFIKVPPARRKMHFLFTFSQKGRLYSSSSCFFNILPLQTVQLTIQTSPKVLEYLLWTNNYLNEEKTELNIQLFFLQISIPFWYMELKKHTCLLLGLVSALEEYQIRCIRLIFILHF